MIIAPFELPSDPAKKIQLREATVAEVMSFSDVDPSHEEELTTAFLNKVQPPELFQNSRAWTADDRRFALYWYWVHARKNPVIQTSYTCDHCGQRHSWGVDGRILAKGYKKMVGKPFRETILGGMKAIVSPLSGESMETLEKLQLDLLVMDKTGRRDSPAYRVKEAELSFETICESLSLPDGRDKRAVLRAMGWDEFSRLMDTASGLMKEMEHGLESVVEDGRIYLLTPPHACPSKTGDDGKELTTRLRVRFRNIDYIPGF